MKKVFLILLVQLINAASLHNETDFDFSDVGDRGKGYIARLKKGETIDIAPGRRTLRFAVGTGVVKISDVFVNKDSTLTVKPIEGGLQVVMKDSSGEQIFEGLWRHFDSASLRNETNVDFFDVWGFYKGDDWYLQSGIRHLSGLKKGQTIDISPGSWTLTFRPSGSGPVFNVAGDVLVNKDSILTVKPVEGGLQVIMNDSRGEQIFGGRWSSGGGFGNV